MRKPIFIPLISILFSIVCMALQCNKISPYTYDLIERFNIIQAKKIYRVGDTIWIQSANTDNKLFDQLSNQYILADSLQKVFEIKCHPWYNAPDSSADGFCDYISNNITGTDYGSGFRQILSCNNNAPVFKLAVIPKHTGIYTLDFSLQGHDISACPDRVQPFPVSNFAYRFNNDCNMDIFLSVPRIIRNSYGDAYEDYVSNKVVYAFKVQ